MLCVYYSLHVPDINESKEDCEITHNLGAVTEENGERSGAVG
jgi:hypothetical protein